METVLRSPKRQGKHSFAQLLQDTDVILRLVLSVTQGEITVGSRVQLEK